MFEYIAEYPKGLHETLREAVAEAQKTVDLNQAAQKLFKDNCDELTGVVFRDKSKTSERVMVIHSIPPKRPNPCSKWLDVRVGDHVKMFRVDNLTEEPNDFIILCENVRTGERDRLPKRAFVYVGVDEMCGCDKYGLCDCKYVNREQSLVSFLFLSKDFLSRKLMKRFEGEFGSEKG